VQVLHDFFGYARADAGQVRRHDDPPTGAQ